MVDNPIPSMQGFRDYLIATYGEENARAMTQTVVAAFNGIVENGGEISLSKVEKITCPVLLIAGEQDPFAPPVVLSPLADRIRKAEVKVVNDVGHDELKWATPNRR